MKLDSFGINMKILRVLNVGEIFQEGDVYRHSQKDPWIVITKYDPDEASLLGEPVEKLSAYHYARPMEVKTIEEQVYIPSSWGEAAICTKFKHVEVDMHKKCENVNTSEAYIFLNKGDILVREDELFCQDGKWVVIGTCSIEWMDKTLIRRKITLPAPLTPIAFKDKLPPKGDLFVYHISTKDWIPVHDDDGIWTDHDLECYSHWIPQDALPVPVVEKSLADELEAIAKRFEPGDAYVIDFPKMHELLSRAAKELRK